MFEVNTTHHLRLTKANEDRILFTAILRMVRDQRPGHYAITFPDATEHTLGKHCDFHGPEDVLNRVLNIALMFGDRFTAVNDRIHDVKPIHAASKYIASVQRRGMSERERASQQRRRERRIEAGKCTHTDPVTVPAFVRYSWYDVVSHSNQRKFRMLFENVITDQPHTGAVVVDSYGMIKKGFLPMIGFEIQETKPVTNAKSNCRVDKDGFVVGSWNRG